MMASENFNLKSPGPELDNTLYLNYIIYSILVKISLNNNKISLIIK